MKFLAAAALSTLLAAVSAAPANITATIVPGAPSITRTTAPTTAPSSYNAGIPGGANVLRPSVRSQYDVWTGAVHYNVPNGKIFKNGKTTDVTTLLTFDIPQFSTPQICQFHFYLDSSATVSGSGLFDVYDSIAPATKDTTTWPQGNLRDNYAGRMKAVKPGEAVWLDGYGNQAKTFLCPDAGKYGVELVGVYDVDDIEWVGGPSGAYITYYPEA